MAKNLSGGFLCDGETAVFHDDFDVQLATKGFDVAAERIDLCPLDIARLNSRDAVLADIERMGELHLGHRGLLTQFPQSIGANFGEHFSLDGFNGLLVDLELGT